MKEIKVLDVRVSDYSFLAKGSIPFEQILYSRLLHNEEVWSVSSLTIFSSLTISRKFFGPSVLRQFTPESLVG